MTRSRVFLAEATGVHGLVITTVAAATTHEDEAKVMTFVGAAFETFNAYGTEGFSDGKKKVVVAGDGTHHVSSKQHSLEKRRKRKE